MNLFSFNAYFGDETSCREHFKSHRDQAGVICASCGSMEQYWIKSRWSYECKHCHHRTSLRSGAVMENTNLSFLLWYKQYFIERHQKVFFEQRDSETIVVKTL